MFLVFMLLFTLAASLKFDRKRIDEAMANLGKTVIGKTQGGGEGETARIRKKMEEPVIKEREVYVCTFTPHTQSSGFLSRFSSTAIASKHFDHVKVYSLHNPPMGIDYSTLRIPQKYIYGPKFVKPYVVLDVMHMARPQDVIIFAEINAIFHDGREQDEIFDQYLDDLSRSVSKRLCFAMEERLEYKYTKGDVFDLVSGRNSSMFEMPQVSSDLFILQNTKENREIMEAWIEIMQTDNYHFLTDTPSITPNAEGFIEHSKETSIFSCLMKLEGFFMERMPEPSESHYFPISFRNNKHS